MGSGAISSHSAATHVPARDSIDTAARATGPHARARLRATRARDVLEGAEMECASLIYGLSIVSAGRPEVNHVRATTARPGPSGQNLHPLFSVCIEALPPARKIR